MGKKYIYSFRFQIYFAHMDSGKKYWKLRFITPAYLFILQFNVKMYMKMCYKFNPFPKFPEGTAGR